MEEELFTVQTYNPGSDVAAGFVPSQIIYGRTGNDTFLGEQSMPANPNELQVDIFLGDLAFEDPAFRTWNDTFVLGDWTQPYYANGNPDSFGLNNFGFIADFNAGEDTVELHGTSNNYQLLEVGVGSAVYLQQDVPDVVGFILGGSNLDLESNSFQYEGESPPPGPVLNQAQQLGSTDYDLSLGTATDPEGNIYIAGGTNGAVEENSGLRDVLVAKYDNQGNQLWAKQFGSSRFDTAYDIATDDQGNFFLTGITQGELASPRQAEVYDAWIGKFDGDGNQQWLEQFGEEVIEQTFSIDVDQEGNAYVSGTRVEASADIATDDVIVAKYDTNGNRQWLTLFGTPDVPGVEDYDESYGVTVGSDGNVYATGWTYGDLEGENAGLYDTWVSQLDNDGNLNWIQQFGTTDYEWAWGVDTDSEGNVYATGWTLGNLGGDNAGSYDVWLIKYDELGNQQWIQQFGTSGDDEPFDLFIDADDNIFLTGYTNSSLEGDNAGSFDAWATLFDTDGNQAWIQQFGTAELEQAYGITADNAGNLYATGITGGSLGATNVGSFDTWLTKLDAASGELQEFSGSGTTLNNLEVVPDSPSDRSPADEEMADFLDSYFQDFIAEIGVEADGSGLTNLVDNPYPSDPQPTTVPEPSAVVSLLMLAGFGISTMLKRQRQKLSASVKAYE
ncbi:MAG: SBBP repeat-containing protein [Cyanophyceae cyanobacterium]